VKLQNSLLRIALFSVLLTISASFVAAQDDLLPKVGVTADRPLAIATGNNLYCAGYIQSSAISTANSIVGAKNEADQHIYSQNDFLYINMGRNKGVNVGDIFSVVRPRAKVNSNWTNKSDIGFYVQEVGAVEIVNVKAEVSVARVKTSCDSFLFGDLVQLTPERHSPMYEQRPPLDLFADYTGKATGRILMARDGSEMPSRDFIVYIDLGADDHLQIGDHLTIFRPLGKGNVYKGPERESVSARDYGFQSLVYKGGKFSNQAARKSGEHAGGTEVTTNMAKKGRPAFLRNIVGEAVVINVKEKTATVVITRTAQEIHTGDWVEIQ
jgi:hypothetical protein